MVKAKGKTEAKPPAIAIVAAALDKVLETKPLKDGTVKVRLAIGKHNLDHKRVIAESDGKGEMGGTLERIWWNLVSKYRVQKDARYPIIKAVKRFPLTKVGDRADSPAYLILTGEEIARMREAAK